MPNTPATPYAYLCLANQMRQQIDSGQLGAGARMPSVRNLCRDTGLSKSTVLSAYAKLEAEGCIEARPRSGFFACTPNTGSTSRLKMPDISQPALVPAPVSTAQVLIDIMKNGAAFDLLPQQTLNQQPRNTDHNQHENLELRRSLARAQRRQGNREQLYYDNPEGLQTLREQLALRAAQGGSHISASDLVISGGCQHALMLALMATTAPGDLVALESPGFYGALQLLETLGLTALELPSAANTGISPEALALALEHWDIKALVLSPSFATPTGALMPDAHKRQILELTAAGEITIIEDDIYGELSFGQHSQRPRTLHSFEQELFQTPPTESRVLLCSSFSKSVSRDLRLGWIAPGRYREKILRLKLVTSLASSQTQQQGLSEFISSGGLDKHLRALRLRLQHQCEQLHDLINQHLPMLSSASQARGGLCLWLELPESVDSIKLYAQARAEGVIITPGPLFSAQDKYRNFIRLSFAQPWTSARINALQCLGKLINESL